MKDVRFYSSFSFKPKMSKIYIQAYFLLTFSGIALTAHGTAPVRQHQSEQKTNRRPLPMFASKLTNALLREATQKIAMEICLTLTTFGPENFMLKINSQGNSKLGIDLF